MEKEIPEIDIDNDEVNFPRQKRSAAKHLYYGGYGGDRRNRIENVGQLITVLQAMDPTSTINTYSVQINELRLETEPEWAARVKTLKANRRKKVAELTKSAKADPFLAEMLKLALAGKLPDESPKVAEKPAARRRN